MWHMTDEDVELEWEKTRDIDNPLSPWVQVQGEFKLILGFFNQPPFREVHVILIACILKSYKDELNLDDLGNFHDRPPLDIVINKFKMAKVSFIVVKNHY